MLPSTSPAPGLPPRGSIQLRSRRSGRRHPGQRHPRVIPLTDEGVPAATDDVPKPSPAVSVSDESRARYPWLPARVIAGSVWRGPEHLRVRVDESGNAEPWRCAGARRPTMTC
jgi:hypothetical protein